MFKVEVAISANVSINGLFWVVSYLNRVKQDWVKLVESRPKLILMLTTTRSFYIRT